MRTWEDYKETMDSALMLFDLARNGDIEAFRALNPSKEMIDVKDGKGYSSLMLAAYNGHSELTRYLLDQGGDPSSLDYAGNSILMGVAFKGQLDIVEMLVEAGADMSVKNAHGQCALAFAEMFGRHEVLAYLKQKQH